MITKATAESESHVVSYPDNRVRRVALFDADGWLVWASAIERPGEVGAPRSSSRCSMSHSELLQQWVGELAPSDGGWQGVGSNVERDLDIPTRTGQRLRLTQRRTPDGGTLVLLGDNTTDGPPPSARDSGGDSDDAGRLAMTESMSWLSQELCTLLNGVVGFAQLMQRDAKEVLTPRQRKRADEIVKAGEQVVGLLGNVLELCGAERGRVALQIAPTDPRTVAEAVRTSIAALAARAGIALRMSESADVPLVLVDARWLHHILTTLARRAIEQACRPSWVGMALSSEGDGVVRIKVSDSGPGIHPDAQATLFLPLRRTRDSDRIEATGLPLAIANRLAELMRCQLRFRSTRAQGSEFWIDLPVCQGSR